MNVGWFQSRNRGSFDFKLKKNKAAGRYFMFQSRNRGSFDFKVIQLLGAIKGFRVSIS